MDFGGILMRVFLQRLHKYKHYQLVFFIIALFFSAAIVLQGFSIIKIVDTVFIQKSAFPETFSYFVLLGFAMLFRLLAQYFFNHFGNHFAAYAKNTIRDMLLTKWRLDSFEMMKRDQTGHKISLYVDTVDELDGYFREYIPQKMKSQVAPIILLICILFANPKSALILLITAPFIPLSYIIIGLQTKQKSEQQLEAMNRFSGKFLDLLHGLQTLKLFSQTEKQRGVLQVYNYQFLNTTMTVLKVAFASTLFIELITTLGVGLIALEIGFQMIIFQTLSFASAFFVLTLTPEFYNSLKDLGAAFHTGKGSMAAMKLIEQELEEKSVPVIWGPQILSDASAPSLALLDATYRYENGTTIGPLSIEIPANKTVAFIGPTGHGKTTALHMLASTVALDQGSISINELERKLINEQSWYDTMCFISQHSFVFAGTVRENLVMGKSFNDEEIVSSLYQAQLTDWLGSLPNGLDTKIGEGGIGLSGGEKQRIAIARALVQKPSLVFFDEPTAGLDVLTEQMITKAMKRLAMAATIIVVTHRFETLKNADFIYCFKNGKIRASGTHETMQEDSFYQAMKNGGALNA